MYTMEYYLTMKKDEILQFEKTWVELESVMLHEEPNNTKQNKQTSRE